jgi:transcription elongation factor
MRADQMWNFGGVERKEGGFLCGVEEWVREGTMGGATRWQRFESWGISGFVISCQGSLTSTFGKSKDFDFDIPRGIATTFGKPFPRSTVGSFSKGIQFVLRRELPFCGL